MNEKKRKETRNYGLLSVQYCVTRQICFMECKILEMEEPASRLVTGRL